ncbi:SusD family protein [compost metagenome]
MSNMRDRIQVSNPRTEIFVRYAAVLLDYIEALNEYNPGSPDIEKYWDMIRSRAGIPGIFTVYPEIRGDKVAQREHILRERQIELAFETDRFFTSRRRWKAHNSDNGDPRRNWGDGGKMWGMDVNAGATATNNFAYTGFYKRVPFEERVFPMKFNLFPILQSEIDKNPAMVQNPGW